MGTACEAAGYVDDAKVAEEFDRRAARQPNENAVLDAHDSDPVRRGNRLRDHVTRTAVLRVVAPGASETILDLGCGVGRLSFPMSRRAGRVLGVDVAGKMIEAARARLAREPRPNLEFIHAAALPLPIAPGVVDKAFACWALAHMSDDRLLDTIRDVRRCLKPAGRFFAFEQVRGETREAGDVHKQRTPGEYEALFHAGGYRLLGRRPVMRSPSYALSLWNRFAWLPAAALPVLDVVERLTVERKPHLADYTTVAFTFER